MGWSGGSDIGTSFWETVRDYIPEEHKEFVARELIVALESQDCDTIFDMDIRLCLFLRVVQYF